jgi:hypothetical protein
MVIVTMGLACAIFRPLPQQMCAHEDFLVSSYKLIVFRDHDTDIPQRNEEKRRCPGLSLLSRSIMDTCQTPQLNLMDNGTTK